MSDDPDLFDRAKRYLDAHGWAPTPPAPETRSLHEVEGLLDTPAPAVSAATIAAIEERLGGKVAHPGATEKLMEYWAHGEGAAKIGWGTPGDFKRCEMHLSKYVPHHEVAGLCSNLHQKATGARPGHAPSEGGK